MTSEELKTWRRTRGYTQEELALLLGSTVRSIENWEQGYRRIPRLVDRLLYYLELGRK